LNIDVELDAKGFICPLPLLKLKQKLNQMNSGQVVRVETTDEGSVRDFNAFLRQAGHELLEQSERQGDCFVFVVRKA